MCNILFIFCNIFLLLSLSYVECDTFEEDNWIEPNAWGREYHQQLKSSLGSEFHQQQLEGSMDDDSNQPMDTCKKCERHLGTTDHELAFVFYKKFIAMLFQRKKLQFNSATEKYTRSLQFILTAEQLSKLETLNDPRDLDGLLSEICLNARALGSSSSYKSMNDFKEDDLLTSIRMLFSDIFKDVIKILNNSEMKFCLAVLCVFVLLFVLRQYYKWRIRYLIFIVFAGAFVFGYLIEYLECNRRLEIEEMIQAIQKNSQSNEPAKKSWFSGFFGGLFGSDGDSLTETANRLRNNANVKLGFCKPLDVFFLYWNKQFFLNLQLMIEQCIETMKTLRAHLSYPQYFLAVIMLIVIIGVLIKNTFQYILSPTQWSHMLHSNQSNHQPTGHAPLPHLQQQHQELHASGDRISGDNLKLLLNAVSAPSIVLNRLTSVTQELKGSGVQEILEQLNSKQQATQTFALKCDETDSSSSSRASETSFEVITDDAEEELNKFAEESIDSKCDKSSDEISVKSSGFSETTSASLALDK